MSTFTSGLVIVVPESGPKPISTLTQAFIVNDEAAKAALKDPKSEAATRYLTGFAEYYLHVTKIKVVGLRIITSSTECTFVVNWPGSTPVIEE
jgi:hypothetical protein